MIPTFTFRNFCFALNFCFAIALPRTAQSQTTKEELEQRMQTLYQKAHHLHDELPNRDYRGNYFTMAVGISPFGHVKTWKTQETCDCNGNVVGTENVSSVKFPMAWSAGWENRLSNTFSFRLLGSYAHLSHDKRHNVVSENGVFTQMRQNYELTQLGLQVSALVHIKDFYGGVGMSRTTTNASGFQTEEKKYDNTITQETPPQYYNLKADVSIPNQTDIAPHFFVGYRMMWSPSVFGSVELGLAQNFYFNFQLNFPLSANIKKSLNNWRKEHREYQAILQQAVAIDMLLNPQKFQTTPICTDSGTTSGGCPN
jgi:hypothetical protein